LKCVNFKNNIIIVCARCPNTSLGSSYIFLITHYPIQRN
jgi:hypothetical protein